jgi:hypothetical protein
MEIGARDEGRDGDRGDGRGTREGMEIGARDEGRGTGWR